MMSRKEAMRRIAQRTGVDFEAVSRHSHAIQPMSVERRSGVQHQAQDGFVTARWLALILLAIAIGDAERVIPVLTSMENTFLDKVVTRREVDADCDRENRSILLTLQELSMFEREPGDWDLRGESFVEALIGLVEQLARDGSHHKYLGSGYRIEVSGSETAAYISIKTEMAGEDGKSFERIFEYEPEATLDDIAPRDGTRGSCRKLPIRRASTLTSCHVRMIAGILATARDSQFAGLVH